jgi:hypothetical protein
MIVDDALMADLIAEANSLAGAEGLVLKVPDDLVLGVGTRADLLADLLRFAKMNDGQTPNMAAADCFRFPPAS